MTVRVTNAANQIRAHLPLREAEKAGLLVNTGLAPPPKGLKVEELAAWTSVTRAIRQRLPPHRRPQRSREKILA